MLEMESELMDLKYQLEQERALRVKSEQVRLPILLTKCEMLPLLLLLAGSGTSLACQV